MRKWPESSYFKCLFLVMVFLLVIFSNTKTISAVYLADYPLFTKSQNNEPVTNSEPINLLWQGVSAQQVAKYYVSQGWSEVTGNAWKNIKMEFNFNPFKGPIGIYLIVEGSGSVWIDESNIGGSSKVYNWNNITFVKNDEHVGVLASACFINFAMPLSRDHFRIWQVGTNVLGSATHDNGFESSTVTYFENLVNFYSSLFCGAVVAGIIASIMGFGSLTAVLLSYIVNVILIPVIHYLLINPLVGSTGGHLVASYPNGWSTAKIVADDWSVTGNQVTKEFRSSGLSSTWMLTDKNQQWDYLSYEMQYANSTNLNITHKVSKTDLTGIISNLILYMLVPIQIIKQLKKWIRK